MSLRLRVPKLAWIYIVNVIAVLFTLGLATPWAVIRTFRYRMKHLIVAAPTTAVFAAAPASEVSATGEEMAEMFDVHVDFGL